jgi:hypothetical protein
MIDDLAATFGLRRSDLNVVGFNITHFYIRKTPFHQRATAKGLFCGSALRLILRDGTKIYGNNNEVPRYIIHQEQYDIQQLRLP